MLAAVLALVSACAPGTARPPGGPELRIMSVPFDVVVGGAPGLRELEGRLGAHGVNAVAISAGRVDWTTFDWSGEPDRTAPTVSSQNDPFGEAVELLGSGRHVAAVVDVFAERLLQERPELAAVDEHGAPSTFQVSPTALAEGAAGERLLEMIRFLLENYPVDSIDLTELHYDTHGFGEDDLASYRATTGRAGWPRDDEGGIDLDDPSLGTWRSARIADFVAAAADVAHAHGAELLVDVRVSWEDLARNAVESGQDYEVLLESADRLVLWNYFALNGRPAGVTREIVEHVGSLGREDFIISIGLWSEDGTIPPRDLEEALRLASSVPSPGVWVVPSSMLEEGHWDAVARVWGRSATPG